MLDVGHRKEIMSRNSFRLWFWRIFIVGLVFSITLIVVIYAEQLLLKACCGENITDRAKQLGDGISLVIWLILSIVLNMLVRKKLDCILVNN